MSRIGKQPISIPSGVVVEISESNVIRVKGRKGDLSKRINSLVKINVSNQVIKVSPNSTSKKASMQWGTARALINNMVIGVDKGFERKLQLVGVGYRAKSEKKSIKLTIGYSHPVDHLLPEEVTSETPSQTEIILKSANKELIGKVAADIRNHRKPTVYKGKGIRYANERVITKEAKKK
jgi:large subunit ribosomal protein L6